MTSSLIKCGYCKKSFFKENKYINRAERDGLKLFCNNTCYVLSRRALGDNNQRSEYFKKYPKKYKYKRTKESIERRRLYDQERRTKVKYGDFWECKVLNIQIGKTLNQLRGNKS